MKSLLTILKNNIWYIVIGATVVTAGAGIAITKPWDSSLEVGTWEPYEIIGVFNSSISVRVRIENNSQASKNTWLSVKSDADKMINEYHCSFTNKKVDEGNCGSSKNVLGLNKTMEKFEVSYSVYDALKYGIEMNKKTDGYFSIAQGKILSLWKDNLIGKKADIDEDEQAKQNALAYVESKIGENINTLPDDQTIELAFENGKYYARRKTDVLIDLGGIAKAIVTDKLSALLKNNGYTRFYINSGGSSWTISGKYINESGKIGATNPSYVDECVFGYEYLWLCDNESKTLNGQYYKAIDIEVTDISLGTSGDYAENNFIKVDGKRYHHIINPKTGRPSEGIRSTTIVSNSATESDVWSTALMARGADSAKEFFATNPDLIATYYDGVAKKTELTKKAKESNRVKVCTSATDC